LIQSCNDPEHRFPKLLKSQHFTDDKILAIFVQSEMSRFSVIRSPSLSSILNWFRNSRAKKGPSRPKFIISEPEPLETEGQERTLRLEEEVSGFAGSQLQSSLLRLPVRSAIKFGKNVLIHWKFGLILHCKVATARCGPLGPRDYSQFLFLAVRCEFIVQRIQPLPQC
jgi:hypothetical protein